jgi:hypothetical protein
MYNAGTLIWHDCKKWSQIENTIIKTPELQKWEVFNKSAVVHSKQYDSSFPVLRLWWWWRKRLYFDRREIRQYSVAPGTRVTKKGACGAERGEIYMHSDLNTAWRWKVNLSPWLICPVPTRYKGRWAPEPVWTRCRQINETLECWASNPDRQESMNIFLRHHV